MQDLKDLKSRFFKKDFAAARERILQILKVVISAGSRLSRRSGFPDRPSSCRDVFIVDVTLQILIQTVRGIAGDRPPRYGNRTVAEPKNSPLSQRSRGTGPRATGTGRFLDNRTAVFPVGRGPVPRHAAVYQTALLGP